MLLAFLLIVAIGAAGGFIAARRAKRLRAAQGGRMHSLPAYHGMLVAMWAIVPALALVLVAQPAANALARQAVLATAEGQALVASSPDRVTAILEEARQVADQEIAAGFNPEANALAPHVAAAKARYAVLPVILGIFAALGGAFFALRRIAPAFRARNAVEGWVRVLLIGASSIAVLTTLGIVLSLLFESILFFRLVSPVEFLFSTRWNPAGEPGHFGSLPLFWGTAFIGAIIAMIVAVPLGLMCAIFLTQYAAARVRRILKPTLEILAGVPTVVYGYFAALTVAPVIRDLGLALGISGSSAESALAAGLVMGVMIIPLISSMSDDSIAAVPQAMRDGSLALGATRSETIRQVLMPAALPGVVGGILLAVSRAIGETMIVVMAAGLAANMTANPFASVTTVTVQIVQLLTGDQEFDSAKTLAAFALGLVLFVVTLILNLIALHVVRKYREAYD